VEVSVRVSAYDVNDEGNYEIKATYVGGQSKAIPGIDYPI